MGSSRIWRALMADLAMAASAEAGWGAEVAIGREGLGGYPRVVVAGWAEYAGICVWVLGVAMLLYRLC
jgi:hypothetical protein